MKYLANSKYGVSKIRVGPTRQTWFVANSVHGGWNPYTNPDWRLLGSPSHLVLQNLQFNVQLAVQVCTVSIYLNNFPSRITFVISPGTPQCIAKVVNSVPHVVLSHCMCSRLLSWPWQLAPYLICTTLCDGNPWCVEHVKCNPIWKCNGESCSHISRYRQKGCHDLCWW